MDLFERSMIMSLLVILIVICGILVVYAQKCGAVQTHRTNLREVLIDNPTNAQ